jgi:hypothetical protein
MSAMRLAFTFLLLSIPFLILMIAVKLYMIPAINSITGKMFGM